MMYLLGVERDMTFEILGMLSEAIDIILLIYVIEFFLSKTNMHKTGPHQIVRGVLNWKGSVLAKRP